VKTQQDICTNRKCGHKKQPRQIHGTDYKETIATTAVEMTAVVETGVLAEFAAGSVQSSTQQKSLTIST